MENIETLKNDLIYSIHHEDSIETIINTYRLFLRSILNRDLNYINQETRNRIETCTIAYIYKMIQKGYLTQNNIYVCLKRLINGTSHFKEESNNPLIYARFNRNQIEINFKSQRTMELLEHFLFHEYTHCLCSPINSLQDLGKYREINRVTKNSSKFNVSERTDDYEPIIASNFLGFFINELCAESTACDLLDDYQESRIVNRAGMSSNWITEYNRQYQQPGYEFLKTIFPYSNNINDRELFKRMTIKAIDDGSNLGQEIQQRYMEKNPIDWKEDLHIITTKLSSLINNFDDHRIDISIAIERMKKYKSNFKVIERTDGLSVGEIRKK